MHTISASAMSRIRIPPAASRRVFAPYHGIDGAWAFGGVKQKGNDLNGLARKKKGKQPSLKVLFERRREQSVKMILFERRRQQSMHTSILLEGREQQSQKIVDSKGRYQSWKHIYDLLPKLKSSGDDMDEKPPPPPMVKKYWVSKVVPPLRSPRGRLYHPWMGERKDQTEGFP